MEATCQCRQTTFTCPLPQPICVYICHCTECRRQSGSAFGVSAIFPLFTVTPTAPGADLRKWSRITQFGKTKDCYFCGNCGSRLLHFTEGGKLMTVKGGCLPGLSKEMMKGAVHIWTSEAVVEIPEGVEAYEGEPPD